MKRSLLENLIRWKNRSDRKPLILKGARQVGKTTLLKIFGNQYFKSYHILNFEKDRNLEKIFQSNLDPKHLLQEMEFYLKRPIHVQDLLILDEIQECPRALTSLKYFAEEMPELAVVAAGSLLGIYLTPVSFPVGKVDIMTLYPMTFEEFLLALEDHQSLSLLSSLHLQDNIPEMAHQHLFEQWKHYCIVGGLPEIVMTFLDRSEGLFSVFNKVREKQETLLKTYHADIAKHAGNVNAMHITRVLQSVPAQLARSQDGSAKKFKFQGVIPGIDRYNRLAGAIDWLDAAGLIIKIPIVNSGSLPFSSYISENSFKLYLFDVGLLGAISSLAPQTILQYDYGSYKGFFAENYIAQAFLANSIRALHCWQEKLAEVEFLYEQNGSPIPIEVKSGWVTQAKSLKIFADKYHSPCRIIFSAQPLSSSSTIHRYPLYTADWFPLH